MKKIHKIICSVYLSLFLLPILTFAADPVPAPAPVPKIVIKNPLKVGNTVMDVIVAILNNIVLPIGAVLVVLYIIYAGFTFVTAQGKPKEIEEAKKRLLWSLIGALILLGAVAISKVVCTTIVNITGNAALCGKP